MSTAFTSLAIATGFERRYGVIKRLGSSPLPRSGLLAGKVGGAARRRGAPDRRDLGGRRSLLGWDPAAGGLGSCAVLAVVLGTAAFASLGLFVAGALRAEATLAAANLVYLLLLAGGAVVLPSVVVRRLRATSRRCCPPARSATRCGRPSSTAPSPGATSLVLLVWAVVGTVLTARTFTVGVSTARWRRGRLSPWATLVANIAARGDRRRRPADRLRPRLPDLAALHGRVVHARTARSGLHQAIEFGNRMLTFVLVADRGGHASSPPGSTRPPRPAAGWRSCSRSAIPAQAVHRRHHGADRPEPLGRLVPPAAARWRSSALAVLLPAPPRPPAGPRRPAARVPALAWATFAAAWAGALRRHRGDRLGPARRRRETRRATGSTRCSSASCTPTWCSCSSG